MEDNKKTKNENELEAEVKASILEIINRKYGVTSESKPEEKEIHSRLCNSVDVLWKIFQSDVWGKIKEENLQGTVNPELILVAAPTGAGKNRLVANIKNESSRKYVVLDMDDFRHYYTSFSKDEASSGIMDKEFAQKTNWFTSAICQIMQTIILEKFDGTNLIVTGTIKNTDWAERTFKEFKSPNNHSNINYDLKIYALAVPKSVCEFSAVRRYLALVNQHHIERNGKDEEPSPSRYVTPTYIEATLNNFSKSLGNLIEGDTRVDEVRIYRRETLEEKHGKGMLFQSNTPLKDKKIIISLYELISNYLMQLDPEQVKGVEKYLNKYKSYLENQGVYQELVEVLGKLKRMESKGTEKDLNVIIGEYLSLNSKGPNIGFASIPEER